MKMLKKLMAVALAGALALTVLTGCGASVNKKEILNALNDIEAADGGYYKVEYEDAGTAQADKVITLAQKAYEDTAEKDKADFEPMKALYNEDKQEYTEVCKALGINDKTKDAYSFAIVKVEKYNSQYNKEHAASELAMKVYSYQRDLNSVSAFGTKGTASMNTVMLGSDEYLVVVLKQLA